MCYTYSHDALQVEKARKEEVIGLQVEELRTLREQQEHLIAQLSEESDRRFQAEGFMLLIILHIDFVFSPSFVCIGMKSKTEEELAWKLQQTKVQKEINERRVREKAEEGSKLEQDIRYWKNMSTEEVPSVTVRLIF